MTSPELAQFQPLDASGGPKGDPVRVAFNPGEYTLSKGAQIAEVAIPGLDSPILQFVRGQTETMTLDLFFDTTDMGMADDVTSVTNETDRFYQLVKIDPETHAPPVCLFTWGSEFPGHGTFSKGGSQGPFQTGLDAHQVLEDAHGATRVGLEKHRPRRLVDVAQSGFQKFAPRALGRFRVL